MDKSVLISIQPQHVVNILNGKKILEIRKTVPKGFKGWVYIYCTKSRPEYCHPFRHDPIPLDDEGKWKSKIREAYLLNGKVVARFWLDNLITLQKDEAFDEYGDFFGTDSKGNYYFGEDIKTHSCLELKDIENYWTKGSLFAWCIDKLEIFDEPLQLSDLYVFGSQDHHDFIITSKMIEDDERECWIKSCRLKKAPQSWQYVWRNEQ
ncbi:MAG: hypothetical protein RBQ91_02205 [Acholeplasma sp.]|nr:hypothetical protein [Acholeplasma sp.]